MGGRVEIASPLPPQLQLSRILIRMHEAFRTPPFLPHAAIHAAVGLVLPSRANTRSSQASGDGASSLARRRLCRSQTSCSTSVKSPP